jgi:hypothetical protein
MLRSMSVAMGVSTPSVSGHKAYEGLFKAKLNASIEALKVFFPALGTGSCWKQRRPKPNFLGSIAA